MTMQALVQTVGNAISTVGNTVAQVFGFKSAVEIERDKQLSKTNRAMLTSASASVVLPITIIGIVIFIILSKQKSKI